MIFFKQKKDINLSQIQFGKDYHWLVLSMNSHYWHGSMNNHQIQLSNKNEQFIVNWGKLEQGRMVEMFENGSMIQPLAVNQIQNQLNLFSHQILKDVTLSFQNKIKSDELPFIEGEDKGLQWLQASLTTLKKTLEQVRNRTDILTQISLFAGEKDGRQVMRLKAMSFDLEMFLIENKMRVRVWNNQKPEEKPLFEQDFAKRKYQVHDELVKVLVEVGKSWEAQ